MEDRNTRRANNKTPWDPTQGCLTCAQTNSQYASQYDILKPDSTKSDVKVYYAVDNVVTKVVNTIRIQIHKSINHCSSPLPPIESTIVSVDDYVKAKIYFPLTKDITEIEGYVTSIKAARTTSAGPVYRLFIQANKDDPCMEIETDNIREIHVIKHNDVLEYHYIMCCRLSKYFRQGCKRLRFAIISDDQDNDYSYITVSKINNSMKAKNGSYYDEYNTSDNRFAIVELPSDIADGTYSICLLGATDSTIIWTLVVQRELGIFSVVEVSDITKGYINMEYVGLTSLSANDIARDHMLAPSIGTKHTMHIAINRSCSNRETMYASIIPNHHIPKFLKARVVFPIMLNGVSQSTFVTIANANEGTRYKLIVSDDLRSVLAENSETGSCVVTPDTFSTLKYKNWDVKISCSQRGGICPAIMIEPDNYQEIMNKYVPDGYQLIAFLHGCHPVDNKTLIEEIPLEIRDGMIKLDSVPEYYLNKDDTSIIFKCNHGAVLTNNWWTYSKKLSELEVLKFGKYTQAYLININPFFNITANIEIYRELMHDTFPVFNTAVYVSGVDNDIKIKTTTSMESQLSVNLPVGTYTISLSTLLEGEAPCKYYEYTFTIEEGGTTNLTYPVVLKMKKEEDEETPSVGSISPSFMITTKENYPVVGAVVRLDTDHMINLSNVLTTSNEGAITFSPLNTDPSDQYMKLTASVIEFGKKGYTINCYKIPIELGTPDKGIIKLIFPYKKEMPITAMSGQTRTNTYSIKVDSTYPYLVPEYVLLKPDDDYVMIEAFDMAVISVAIVDPLDTSKLLMEYQKMGTVRLSNNMTQTDQSDFNSSIKSTIRIDFRRVDPDVENVPEEFDASNAVIMSKSSVDDLFTDEDDDI